MFEKLGSLPRRVHNPNRYAKLQQWKGKNFAAHVSVGPQCQVQIIFDLGQLHCLCICYGAQLRLLALNFKVLPIVSIGLVLHSAGEC